MKKRSILAIALVLSLLVTGCGGAGSQDSKAPDKDKITIATLAQIDAFPAWQATKAKDSASLYDLKTYDAGIPMVEDLATKAWQIGDAGAVPTILGVLNRNVEIIGIASDESAANIVLAKKDSPIFKEEAENHVYGSADLLKGKAIYTSMVSSAHYALVGYLKTFGLTEQDVNVQSASQKDCIEALKSGKADLVVLWTPYAYDAMAAGAKVVATGADIGANNLMLYLADKDWAAKNPDAVAKFLAETSRAAQDYTKEPPMDELSTFYKDYIKMPLEEESIQQEIESHQLFTVKEQLELMQSGSCARSMEDIARFFMDMNKLATSNYGNLVKQNFNINDTYLKLAQEKYIK